MYCNLIALSFSDYVLPVIKL